MEEIEQEARRELLKNAIECTNYVAYGWMMAEEYSKRFNIPVGDAKGIIRRACAFLVVDLEKLK